MSLIDKRLPSIEGRGSLRLTVGVMATMIFLVAIFVTKQAGADDIVTRGFKTEGAYTLGPGDSETLAGKLAFFRAGFKAGLSGGQLV